MKKALLLCLASLFAVSMLGGCSTQTSAPPAPSSQTSAAPSVSSEESNFPANWPKGTITYKCGYAAGGTQDLVIRSLAQYAEPVTKNTYYVENITGGSGLIMVSDVFDRDADGSSACIYSCTIPTVADYQYFDEKLLDALLKADLQVEEQLEPVGQVNVDYPAVFIRSNEDRFRTFPELVDYIKAHPGEVSFGATGASGNGGLMTQTFINKFGLDINAVYYDSTPEEKAAMLGGELDVMCTTIAWVASSGKDFTCLGYAAEKGSDHYPGIPTFQEQGFDFTAIMRRGMFVKKGTDPAIVQYMEKLIAGICDDEKYVADQGKLNYTVDYADRATFAASLSGAVEGYHAYKAQLK